MVTLEDIIRARMEAERKAAEWEAEFQKEFYQPISDPEVLAYLAKQHAAETLLPAASGAAQTIGELSPVRLNHTRDEGVQFYEELPPEMRDGASMGYWVIRNPQMRVASELGDEEGGSGPQTINNSGNIGILIQAGGDITIGGHVVGRDNITNNTEVNIADKPTTE